MQVEEVMTRRVLSLRPDASLVGIAKLMRDQDVGSVMITRNGRARGRPAVLVRAWTRQRPLVAQ